MRFHVQHAVAHAQETGWNAVGHVSKITANEEVALELRGPQQVQMMRPFPSQLFPMKISIFRAA